MKRSHLFEFHELSRFPKVWRDLLTDFLSFYAAMFKPYRASAPILAEALRRVRTHRVVDLCSGAGQPVISLLPTLREQGTGDLEIVLTDKYPHVAAWSSLGELMGASVSYEADPVDAVDVPEHLEGFRTLFTSFHHFAPEVARDILADAVAKRRGIGVFEYTERNFWIWAVPVMSIPLLVWFCTPFIRPFRWRRLFWTYLLPVVPVVAFWDGLVSCLRTYSIEELRVLVEGVGDSTYRWDFGRVPSVGFSRVTYAIGSPRFAVGARGQQEPGVAEDKEGEGG
jgi:hypothetical protein